MKAHDVSIEPLVGTNVFGTVRASRLTKAGRSLVVYEQDTCAEGRCFADLHLPLWADIFLRGITQVALPVRCDGVSSRRSSRRRRWIAARRR